MKPCEAPSGAWPPVVSSAQADQVQAPVPSISDLVIWMALSRAHLGPFGPRAEPQLGADAAH